MHFPGLVQGIPGMALALGVGLTLSPGQTDTGGKSLSLSIRVELWDAWCHSCAIPQRLAGLPTRLCMSPVASISDGQTVHGKSTEEGVCTRPVFLWAPQQVQVVCNDTHRCPAESLRLVGPAWWFGPRNGKGLLQRRECSHTHAPVSRAVSSHDGCAGGVRDGTQAGGCSERPC